MPRPTEQYRSPIGSHRFLHGPEATELAIVQAKRARAERAMEILGPTGVVPIIDIFLRNLRDNDPTAVKDFGFLPGRNVEPVAAVALRWGATPLLRPGTDQPFVTSVGPHHDSHLWVSHAVRVDEKGNTTFLVTGDAGTEEVVYEGMTPGVIAGAIEATDGRAFDFRTGNHKKSLKGHPGLGTIGRRR